MKASVESHVNAASWMKQVQEHSSDSVKVILIGNKSDLAEERKITFQEGKDMAVKYDVPFFEVSAKMN